VKRYSYSMINRACDLQSGAVPYAAWLRPSEVRVSR
jgi:hypothetical protein